MKNPIVDHGDTVYLPYPTPFLPGRNCVWYTYKPGEPGLVLPPRGAVFLWPQPEGCMVSDHRGRVAIGPDEITAQAAWYSMHAAYMDN